MKKGEVINLLNIYNKQGTEALINYLNNLKEIEELKEIEKILKAYIHITNEDKNSLYYSSNNEQIITNNNTSIIYFNKKLFDFKNINFGKIVRNNAIEVCENEIKSIFDNSKLLFGENYSKIMDTRVRDKKIDFLGNNNYKTFNYEECKLIKDILITPTFKLSDENSVLYAEGINGCAYVLGEDSKDKFKSLKLK